MKTLPKAIKQRRHPDYVWHFNVEHTHYRWGHAHTSPNEFELHGYDNDGSWYFELIYEPHLTNDVVKYHRDRRGLFEGLFNAARFASIKYKNPHEHGGYDLDERKFSRAISKYVYALANAYLDDLFVEKAA